MAPTLSARAANTRLLLLDVDGVLTDGRLYRGPGGMELKAFHVRDGYGLKRLMGAGIQVGVISGRDSQATRERLEELGVEHVHLGVRDKTAALARVLQHTALAPHQAAFMGDDLPDLQVMQRVGLALTVADAHPGIRAIAHWVSSLDGGCGAVREACDWLLDQRASEATP